MPATLTLTLDDLHPETIRAEVDRLLSVVDESVAVKQHPAVTAALVAERLELDCFWVSYTHGETFIDVSYAVWQRVSGGRPTSQKNGRVDVIIDGVTISACKL